MAGNGQLKVDYDDLQQLDVRLTAVISTMREDGQNMSALATAVGDERLATRVREFGSSWAVHRHNIRENLEWLRDSVRNIHEDMAATDAELAAGLKEG